MGQTVGGDGLVMVAVGGLDAVAPALAATEARFLHEPGNAVTPMAFSGLAQFPHQTRAAVGLAAALMDQLYLPGQLLILRGARAGRSAPLLPVIIAAGRDAEDLAQQADGMFIFHRIDPLVALGGGSERMPSVFFRMSRCSRRWRISR